MGAWHNTYTDLVRTRFSALVAYANLLEDNPGEAKELAQSAAIAVFGRRKRPKGLRAAELAAREWMAVHATDPVRAAIVLQAIDAKDGAGVKAVLRKATPDPLPSVTDEQTHAMRVRFVEASGVYAVPTGGVNALIGPARQQRRSALGRAAVGTVAAIAAVAVGGYAALNYLPTIGGPAAEGPTASGSPNPSPSADLKAVSWNPKRDFDAAFIGFKLPECGDEFKPTAQSVGGLTPEARATIQNEPGYGAWFILNPNFVGDSEAKEPVLADPTMYVITLDHEVVYTSRQEFVGMELYHTNSAIMSPKFGVSRSDFCDARVDFEEMIKDFKEFNWDTATSEEKNAWDKAWRDFEKRWSDFEPGTYRLYYVTPMVFGEQLALAEAFAADGVDSLQELSMDIGSTELSRDDRVAPYCSGSRDAGDWTCQVPPDVLREVLTREIDLAKVREVAPGIGISVPLVHEVPAE